MILEIKPYTDTDRVHESTSWYQFLTSDTIDPDDAIWSIEESVDNKTILDKDISVPQGEVNYIVAYRHFDDDTVVRTLTRPITLSDTTDITLIDIQELIESPTISVVQNTIDGADGVLDITTSSIRPASAIFSKTIIVVFADEEVIDCVDTATYDYSLDASIIPKYAKELKVTVAHQDIFGVMSDFGYEIFPLGQSLFELRNPLIVSSIDYRPIFKYVGTLEVLRITLMNGAGEQYVTTAGHIPAEEMKYGNEYSLIVEATVDGVLNTNSFTVHTVQHFSESYDLEYEYHRFKNTDIEIELVDGKYDMLQNNKVFTPIDKDTYAIKFLNSDYRYFISTYSFAHEPDFTKPINIVTVSDFESLMCYTSVDGDNVLSMFAIDPTLYRVIKVTETVLTNIVSNIAPNRSTGKLYGIENNDDTYSVCEISYDGTIVTLDTIVDSVSIGDNLFVEVISNELYIVGDVDGIIHYNTRTKIFQVLLMYDDDIRTKELFFTKLINKDLLIVVKEDSRMWRYSFINDSLIEYTSPLSDVSVLVELPNGGILLQNDTANTIFY